MVAVKLFWIECLTRGGSDAVGAHDTPYAFEAKTWKIDYGIG